MALAPKALTLEEFLRLPEEKPALEYFHGVVEQKMSPKTDHSALQAELTERINAVARHTRIARAFPELRTTFGGESPVPDVSVFRWDRLPRDARGRLIQDLVIPPDIAIEILSPGQTRGTLMDRCRWYVANGVELALLVNSGRGTILAFRPGGTEQEWRGLDRIDLDPVVPRFHLTVEDLFAAINE
jgi:Uma2 family endonuclease